MKERNYAAPDEIMYHTGLSHDMLAGATCALLPGDPGRVSVIASRIGEARPLAVNREYTSWLSQLDDRNVLICSTGMGGPSVAICLEELARIGVTTFIRIGTTGSLQEEINIGDVIINDSAVRLDGTSGHYAPEGFPAVADVRLTMALVKAAEKLKLNFACGTTASSDTFWPGQERYDSFTGYVPRRFRESVKEWQTLGCTNMEMEAATLFTVARVFGLKAACICGVVAKRTDAETVDKGDLHKLAIERCIKVVKEVLREI